MHESAFVTAMQPRAVVSRRVAYSKRSRRTVTNMATACGFTRPNWRSPCASQWLGVVNASFRSARPDPAIKPERHGPELLAQILVQGITNCCQCAFWLQLPAQVSQMTLMQMKDVIPYTSYTSALDALDNGSRFKKLSKRSRMGSA